MSTLHQDCNVSGTEDTHQTAPKICVQCQKTFFYVSRIISSVSIRRVGKKVAMYRSLKNILFKKCLWNKKALKMFWGLVQIQAKSAFSGYFRVPDKHYCLINPEISFDNLTGIQAMAHIMRQQIKFT